MSLQFYALKADNGWYIPHPLGRNGRGGTHVELVDPASGIAPRLFNNEGSAKAALRWWLREQSTWPTKSGAPSKMKRLMKIGTQRCGLSGIITMFGLFL